VKRVLVALLTAGLSTLACTGHHMHRAVSLEQQPDYSLAFIEFDDQGELWAPAQLDRALNHLERLNSAGGGVALVLFIHGWNTDASQAEEKEGKGTIHQYRAILSRLAAGLREEVPQVEIPVMGVYLGWRGRVSSVPLLREASFYNRRGAAERIAGPPATEAIYRLLTTMRRNPAARSVLIGHSFGSMILEQALSQAVVSALLAAPEGSFVFPADLVVLLNPAGSATRTKQLVEILARNRLKTYRYDVSGNRYERPLLVSFTSESDTATRAYFPFGMGIKAINKRFRAYGQGFCSPVASQRRLYTHTAGHLTGLHSHEVVAGGEMDPSDRVPPPGRLIPGYLGYDEEIDPHTQQISFSFDGARQRFTVRRRPWALNDTPYWIMQVPRDLIPDHSTVLTEDTFSLLEAVLVLSGTYDADTRTVVEREDGVRPLAIVPRPNGTALFLDRSRGVYAVERGSGRPIFLSCLTESVDPSDAVGFHVAGNLAYTVLSTRLGAPSEARCLTRLYEFEIADDGYRLLSIERFEGRECPSAAAVDVPGKRAFLTYDTPDGPLLRVADLKQKSPQPRDLLALSGRRSPTALYYDAAGTRLFTAQAGNGELWSVDLADEIPSQRRIDYDVGSPRALAFDRTEHRLYVTDSLARTLWALDCSGACGQPRALLRSEALQNPTTLAVGLEGTIWLGDLQAQTLMALSRDGEIEGTIRSLSGAPGPAGDPAPDADSPGPQGR
jgi:hypothetical protein